MDFGILGPLEVRRDGVPIEVPGTRQRAVLAALLLSANQVVSSERLLDDVWGEDLPSAGATALRVRISQLRRALAPDGDLIATRSPGYVINLEPRQLDMHSFERLVREGDQALARGDATAAAAPLEEALALWRGPALADFPYAVFAQGPIRRLEELRMSAREQLIGAQLALGDHQRLLAELQELVSEHPLRERLWAHLMLALYRNGRQAEALEAYRRARRTLAEEVGIEPGPELRALEHSILNQAPELGGTVRVARSARVVMALPGSEGGVGPLAAVGRSLAGDIRAELIVSAIVSDEPALARMMERLKEARGQADEGGAEVRSAAFTSDDPGADITRLAAEHDVALVLMEAPPDALGGAGLGEPLITVLQAVAADVAVVAGADRGGQDEGPVVVPFAGHDHDWAALEAGAWLARALDVPLRLVGTRAAPSAGRRDASRLLASASLALQRGVGVASDYVLADAGAGGVLQAGSDAAFLVTGLSGRWIKEGLGEARAELAREAPCPVLFLRRGVSPGGLAPPEALTRFTWSRVGA
jgi:DNA-binding SARP family transcriptional activator